MRRQVFICFAITIQLAEPAVFAQRTVKPVLHGRHWVAVTGKPLAATAGALIFASTLVALALGGPRWLGAVTPIGGALMIAGWLVLAWATFRAP